MKLAIGVLLLVIAAERRLLPDDAEATDFQAAITRVVAGLKDGHGSVFWKGRWLF